jgi:hypothetical protein
MIRKYSEGESVAQAMGVSESWHQARSEHSHGTSETTTRTPSRNYSFDPVERMAVYPGDLVRIPSPRVEGENGLVVRAYMSVEGNAWKECATHMERASLTIDETVEDIQHRPNEDFSCDDLEWSEADYQRLGLVEGQGPPRNHATADTSPFEAMIAGAGGGETPLPFGEEDEGEDGEQSLLLWFDEGELEELQNSGGDRS